MPAARSLPANPFPASGLLPKESTQAVSFRRKYPTYDGRGVRVAILDTGVDVNALGLNQKGHVVESIDCTGSGDIPLKDLPASAIKTTSEGLSVVSPATGRTLLLSPKWTNPRGIFKYGSKAAYEIWPTDLKKRRQDERKRAFDVETNRLLAHAQREVVALTGKKEAAAIVTEEDKAEIEKKEPTPADPAAAGAAESAKAQQVAEVRARIAVLKDLQSSWKDPGPIIEVIVFHDGENWKTVVGGGEGEIHDFTTGLPASQLGLLEAATLDLRSVKPIADFSAHGEHDHFGEMDLLTFSVSVITEAPSPSLASADSAFYDAKTLSLVVVSGSHGTHVAGIVGARAAAEAGGSDIDPTDGVAPAAEIVSLTIGDARLGSMETGQALLRAAQALITTRCDIANMSFGEDGAFGADDKGAFATTLRDMVIRHRDILFISSAGNNGPALTTIGHPGGSTSAILSVGAYVTAGAMQRAEYALVEDCKDSVTTWCSRGPTSDGERGVDIYSPGAAITSIPRYSLQNMALYNGTSMSSPNACGSIALLLSAMKQEKIPITAARVYRAIRESGKDVQDDLGVPYLQVDEAWNYLVKHKDRPEADAEFRIEVAPPGKPAGSKNNTKRGIYLRELMDTTRASQFSINVKPTFKPDEKERSLNLELRCAITTNASWVKVPEFLLLGGNGRAFEVRVDPTQLEAGRLHTAWIEVFDTDTPGHKLFDIPVVVAKPAQPSHGTSAQYSLSLSAGKVDRHFLHVPEGATWAIARIRSRNHAAQGVAAKCWVHLVQLEPLQRLHEVEQAWVFGLNEDEPVTKKFPIRGGMTVEVCLAQFWAQAASFDVDFELEFHGIQISRVAVGRDELTILGGEGIARLECASNLRVEEFKPSISFDTRRTFVRPSKTEIRSLPGLRDSQPSGQQLFELINTYDVKLSEASNNIRYSVPLSGNLYDSSVPLLSQLFDIQKKRVDFGDVYPKDVELPKGDYTLRVQLLNESLAVLEKQRNMTLRLDQKLSKPKDVKLDVYEDHVDLFGETKPASFKPTLKLFPGERKMLCFDTNLEGDAVPKEASPGDILLGSFSFAPEAKTQLRYIVPPAVKKDKDKDPVPNSKPEKESTVELLTSLVKKFKDDDEKKIFLERLVKDHPDDLGVLVANLEALDADKAETAADTLKAANEVLSRVDQTELSHWLGVKQLPALEQSAEVKKANKLKEQQKSAVTLALNRKARALLATSPQGGDEFEKVFQQYRTYYGDNGSDPAFTNVAIRWHMIHKRYGTALQATRKLVKDLGAGTAENLEELKAARQRERELVAADKLDWKVWQAHFDRLRVLEAPEDWAAF